MAEVRFKEVYIEEILNIISENHKYTKRYIEDNKGKYSVFSATIGEPFGYVNNYDYEEMEIFCVVNYGNSGKTFRIFDEKFSIGRNVCGLHVKDEYVNQINLEYVRVLAEPKFVNRAKGTKQKNLNQRLIKKTTISIPIDRDGNFDLEKQNEIVKRYEMLERRKKEIEEKLNHINEVEVDFLDGSISKSKQIHFEDLFDIERGKVISRSYINENGGDYPVYSTQIDEPFGFIDDYMYDGEYLIWNTDGLGGYIRLVNDKFSITNIVGIMKLKEIYKGKVNLEFIRRILQPIFRSNTKGREGIDGKNEYTKINSTMIRDLDIKIDFPVDKNGEIDLEKQNEIVKKFGTIDEMKRKITDKGLPFIHANIELDGLTPYIYIYNN